MNSANKRIWLKTGEITLISCPKIKIILHFEICVLSSNKTKLISVALSYRIWFQRSEVLEVAHLKITSNAQMIFRLLHGFSYSRNKEHERKVSKWYHEMKTIYICLVSRVPLLENIERRCIHGQLRIPRSMNSFFSLSFHYSR